MSDHIENLLRKIPGRNPFLRAYLRGRDEWRLRRFRDKAAVFTHYYESNYWGDKESVSGAGSTLDYTKNIREKLPALFASLGIKSMLDAPCGDYNWFQHVARPGVRYVGGDIVPPLIARNNEQFGNAETKFMVLDITSDPLPEVDLWMCRDCLFHLPNADVLRALQNFRASNIRYLLTSTHPEADRNKDIRAGSFRLLNLRLPPFNLVKPQLTIDDWVEGHSARHLALWDRSMMV